MKLLIIGSKGFIGLHVQRYFSSLPGFTVWGCDVVTDYAAKNYFLIDAANANFETVMEEKFDVCINCAGAASVPDSMLHPLRDYYLNSRHVFNILDALRKHSASCRFLNLSSAAVYGNPKQLPIAETHPAAPLSPYGWHKYQSELICQEFFEIYGMATCSVRIFSAYGTGLQKQLFWDWYQKIKISNDITLFGTGRESRDFIFIDDVVQAIACIVKNAAFNADIVNVANGKQTYINEAMEVFKKESNINFAYQFNNEVRKGDPLNWEADINKLKLLGYEQTVSFEAGIKKYIQWLNERKE